MICFTINVNEVTVFFIEHCIIVVDCCVKNTEPCRLILTPHSCIALVLVAVLNKSGMYHPGLCTNVSIGWHVCQKPSQPVK